MSPCDAQVLTTGSWPTQSTAKCNLPRELERGCEDFKAFYLASHSGRKLSWQTNMGNAGAPAVHALQVAPPGCSRSAVKVSLRLSLSSHVCHKSFCPTCKPALCRASMVGANMNMPAMLEVESKQLYSLRSVISSLLERTQLLRARLSVNVLPCRHEGCLRREAA